VAVDDLLAHKISVIGVEGFLERFLFLFARWFYSSGSYSYPCMSPQRQQQYDQCDQVEEELEAAQSKASNKAH
jgi:hypothetical protein